MTSFIDFCVGFFMFWFVIWLITLFIRALIAPATLIPGNQPQARTTGPIHCNTTAKGPHTHRTIAAMYRCHAEANEQPSPDWDKIGKMEDELDIPRSFEAR